MLPRRAPGLPDEAFERGDVLSLIHIWDTMDMAAASHFEEVVLVGHIGKLVKLAGGVMNTHSRTADCRTELLCAHAALCGAPRDI